MDRIFRNKIITFCIAAVLFGSLAPLTGAEIVRKPASATYKDPDTGLIFQPRVHNFEKVSVRVNPDPRFGTVIAYENETGTFADIFLYRLTAEANKPVTQEQFRKHVTDTVQTLLTMNQRSTQIKAVKRLEIPNTLPVQAAETFQITVRDETFLSLLYLWEYKNCIIKVRITYSEQQKPERNAAMQFVRKILTDTGKLEIKKK